MKKSYIYITASLMVIISVIFTSCSNAPMYTDKNGTTHIIATNEDNQVIQDEHGYIYEEVTDKDGKTVTQLMEYPTVSTNKNSSVMENAGLKIDVPKGWKNTELSNVFRIHHAGKCVELDAPPCEIEVKIRQNLYQQEVYDENKGIVYMLQSKSSDISDVKEYTAEICGKKALAISYHVDSSKFTNMCFCVQNGQIVVEISVSAYDDCFNSDSVVELLNSCITFKDLGPDAVPTTEATSEDLSTTVTK